MSPAFSLLFRYGFNPGSSLVIDNAMSAQVAARAAVTTTLSGAAAGMTSLGLGFMHAKSWDLLALCNGVLVGFVAVTAGAHVLEPWAAILDGAIASVVFETMCWVFLYKFRIDDPLSAAPMHAFGGASGIIFVGLLAKQEYIQQAYKRSDNYGLFYGGGGKLLACQVVGLLVIAAWTMTNMFLFFSAFKALGGSLRIDPEDEV
jgi:Amt family ammonium transporter